MEELKSVRGVFHSEADFQHTLAWKIREKRGDLKVRLERPIETQGRTIAIDIWLTRGKDTNFAIELKYHKAAYSGNFKGEAFDFPKNNPRDYCYNVLADVDRLEQLIKRKEEKVKEGAMILISNQSKDWKCEDAGCNFEKFSLHNKRVIKSNEKMNWKKGTSKGYKGKSRLKPIKLNNDYKLKWRPYHKCPVAGKNNEFQWLGIEVK